MRVLNITELRKWAKESGFEDSWWVSINGITSENPIKLAELPRKGDVLLLNTSSQGTEKEEWLVCRYPGYKTHEEKAETERLKNLPTIKQTLALEFFGHKQEVTREEATELLDKYFSKPSNYGRYQDYLWDNYEQIYSGRNLYEKTVERLKNQMFFIKENAPKHKIESLIDEAMKSEIYYKSFVELVKARYPEILLADSTQQRKRSAYENHNRQLQEWKSEQIPKKKYGCLGLLLLLLVPTVLFFVLINF